ncbi:OLC1v1010221C1 [Oldenlandia corymbosa var. corymbosa]|uniref:OLC1v1010221C1 n=1 Tax=Oldenlandia corymbosa var. corymbosa TaxID=529605 RepID=A0AAV1DQS9_OLDCO|nr:OLC1v1010221C1 [Oldenlandia corymbosa var. corymbosa]
MGQSASASSHGYSSGYSSPGSSRRRYLTANQSESSSFSESNAQLSAVDDVDFTLEIPDECLALIFQSLSSGDRKRCSVVCRRWLAVEGESRHRLALNATADIHPHIPAIFTRFDSVTKLALRCDRKSISINDDGLALISLRCRNLTRLKLRGCRQVTDLGMSFIAKNCKVLKKFSCGSCTFGAEGMNALLDHCSTLEELSVKRLRGVNDGVVAAPIGPGAAAASLKSICLKELYNGLSFGPLILGSKNLKTLKLLRCLGDWDRLLETMAKREDNNLVEIHLERLQLSDIGLTAISKCPKLEILHLVKALDCTNAGVVAVAENCKLLRKLHIDGWRSNRIGDEGLIAIAKNSVNLQELVLIGLNPSSVSMSAIASNCKKLERLALCGSETIGDAEISYIAEKCVALRKLCIKGCHVSDQGIEAFAWGCPNLVKIKVKKCREVTSDFADWLRARRATLTVSLDVEEAEVEAVEVSASDAGEQEDGAEFPSSVSRATNAGVAGGVDVPSSQNAGRSSAYKPRLGIFGGRSLVACTFGRWLNTGNGSSNSGVL